MEGGLVPRDPAGPPSQFSQPLTPGLISPAEHVTNQFYDWEKRGRGWQTWPDPVVLEPPFKPFLFHTPHSRPVVDDGQTPHLLVRAFESVAAWFGQRNSAPLPTEPIPEWEVEPDPMPFEEGPVTAIQVGVPVDLKVVKDSAEQLLLNLSACSYPLSFEVVGTSDRIHLQFACREEDQPTVHQQMRAHFPGVRLKKDADCLVAAWDEWEENAIVDFGLSREFMLPLKTLKGLEPDPWVGIIGSLSELAEKEIGVLQVLFQRTAYPWTESVIRAVSDGEGGSFFGDAPEVLELARQKISRALYGVVIRVGSQAKTKERAWRIAKQIGSCLGQLGAPASNELIPLRNDEYDERHHELDLLGRLTRRSGMILNSEELVSLVHLPSASVQSSKLRVVEKNAKLPPAITQGHELLLGHNREGDEPIAVTLSPEQRTKHTYIIGASGTGKSTLLLNMILQDIEQGRGVGILDPHGDLVDQIVERIPEKRIKDVILFDPSDTDCPIGFNILSAHSEAEKNLLASDLVAVFRRLSTSWGDQMNSVLANAILAFLESTEGGTLLDLRRFLLEGQFRSAFLKTVRDPEVVYYWQREFPLLPGKSLAPLMTRLDTFIRPKLVRYLVAQKNNNLVFGRVMNEGKIFLAKLAQGAIGEENAYLLGSLLVSKFQQSALGRQSIPESQRRPFFLTIDEFHCFLTPSLVSLLSGGRKFGIGLILAHQELRQLLGEDSSVASAVLANPYTRVCFRLGDYDAKKMAEGFSSFAAKDLQNLGLGKAVCRVERAEYDFLLETQPLPEVKTEDAKRNWARIVANSRTQYGTPRAQIEAELAKKYLPQDGDQEMPAAKSAERAKPEKLSAPKPVPIHETPEEPAVAPAETRSKRAERPKSVSPQLMGKGGPQHKYLQHLIKRYAEDKGFKATIEKQVEGGSVDVSLEKEGQPLIACEVSITSTPEQEIGNLEKCLRVGYPAILLISPERHVLTKTQDLARERLPEADFLRVRFLTPEELISFLEEMAAGSASEEKTVKGYKVKTTFRPMSETEKEERKRSVAQTIWQSIKRIAGKK